MNRLIWIGLLLSGLSYLGLSQVGCNSPDLDDTTAGREDAAAAEVAPTPTAGEVVAAQPAEEPTQERTATEASPTSAPEEAPAEPTPQATAPATAEVRDAQAGTDAQPFASYAFPPVMPDTERHQKAWFRDDCLRCHETGVENAPQVKHAGMSPILLMAKCRSCHVLIPGTPVSPPKPAPEEPQFAVNAFPPMIPASGSHLTAWNKDDCLSCHEDGTHAAPVLVHEGLPRILLQAKCRTCHVQVRAVEASIPRTPE